MAEPGFIQNIAGTAAVWTPVTINQKTHSVEIGLRDKAATFDLAYDGGTNYVTYSAGESANMASRNWLADDIVYIRPSANTTIEVHGIARS